MVASLAKLTLAALAACAVAAWPLAGQAQQQQQQQRTSPSTVQQPETPAQQPPQAPPALQQPKLNPKEEADYKAFSGLKGTDTDAIASKGESFLKDYPDSRYRPAVYAKLAIAYQAKGDEPKMLADAEKAVELNPNEVSALSLLAFALPRRLDPNAPGAEAQMQKVEQYADHAIQLLNAMQKPADMADGQFALAKKEGLGSCHSGLGLVSLYRNNVPKAIAELEQATQLAQDPVDFFLLGWAYEQANRFSDAVGAFTQCGAIAGPIQSRCKARMEDAKKKAAAASAPAK